MNLIFIFLIIIGIIIILSLLRRESPQKKAGREGEDYAASVISEVLKSDDVLLRGVQVSLDGKRAEFDELVINTRGVFIIEVKNWSGNIYGDVDDHEWKKRKETRGGNVYCKTERNPIQQVNREIYILANYLKKHNIKVWVDGYVYFVNNNCPVHTDQVLESKNAIDHAIHHGTNNGLTKKQVNAILHCLK